MKKMRKRRQRDRETGKERDEERGWKIGVEVTTREPRLERRKVGGRDFQRAKIETVKEKRNGRKH